jgi:PKHD-type hydroxylase
LIVTIPNLLPAELAAELVQRLQKEELVDGSLTAGPHGQGKKRNKQLVDTPAALEMSEKISAHLRSNQAIVDLVALKSSLPFMFNCHEPGMEYRAHTDNPFMYFQGAELRTDLSATIFLSPPDSYDGGELVIDLDERPTPIKMQPGGIVIYPADSLHAVNLVTRGVRWCAVTWLQSRLRSLDHRRINRHLVVAFQALMSLSGKPEGSAERVALDNVLRAKNEFLRLYGE